MKNSFLAGILVTLLPSGLTYAEAAHHDDSDSLVVYGVRLEQPRAEVGSSVTVISADEIEALGVDYIVDAIARAPGVTIDQNGSQGGAASVRIRGAASAQTLVIVDGVAVNDPSAPSGGFDFARLDPANIDRIEILRGPQSTLWGSDAMGGVINIVTKRPGDGFGGDVFVQGGSYGSLRAGASASGSNERFNFRVAAVHNSTDGISKADEVYGNTEDDAYDSLTVSAVGGLAIGKARLQATVLRTEADTDFDSFFFGAPGNVADGDELSKTEETAASLTLRLPLFDDKLENLFLVGYSDIDRQSFADGQPGFQSAGDRRTYRYQGTLTANDRHRFAFGVEHEQSEAGDAHSSIDGLFTLYEWRTTDFLTLTAGLRNDDHDQYGTETTGRIAAAYNPHEQITLRSSWSEGFKAPTLFQTTFFCCGATEPNANLKPETSQALDVGFTVRTANGRGEVGLTWFDQNTENLIDFSFAIGAYENIATATSDGFEFDTRYQVGDWLEASLTATWVDAKDGAGITLARVPKRTGDLGFAFNPDGQLSATLLVRYNDEEQDATGVVGAWTRVDVSARFILSDGITVYARIENLLDRHYQQVLGYGTPGLSGYIGARLSF